MSLNDCIGDALARDSKNERETIRVGWFFPVEYHDLCHVHGISGAMYSDPVCQHLHGYICTCAELSLEPNADKCATIEPVAWGVSLPAIEILDLVLADSIREDSLALLVENIVVRRRQREAAQQSLKAVSDYFGNEAYEVVIQRKRDGYRSRVKSEVVS